MIELITDGLFTLPAVTIKIKSLADTITIVPFGCVHRNTNLCNIPKWEATLEKMKVLKNAYFLGMGDYTDMFSASERLIFTGRIHETTLDEFDKVAREQVKTLADELSFMKGRLIGLIGGNHFSVLSNGITSDQYLCELLGCKYLGCSSFISLLVEYHGAGVAYKIWAHHGKGAGRTVGGDIQRVEQMQNAMDADFFCMGHSHHRSIIPATDRLEIVQRHQGTPYLRKRPRWLARTGSFLNSYVPGMKSYIADAAKNPVNQGCVKLDLQLVVDRERDKSSKSYRIEPTGGYL